MKFIGGKRVFSSLYLAVGYTLSIFSSLYFTPFLTNYLARHDSLQSFISGVYASLGLLVVTLFLYKYQIANLKAYLLFFFLFVLFLFEFFSTPILVERIHLIEYAILYALWFRVWRHFFNGVLVYGVTLWFSCLLGLLDEGVQDLLPNRFFDWNDVYLNLFGVLLGISAVAVLMRYRNDKKGLAVGEPGEPEVT